MLKKGKKRSNEGQIRVNMLKLDEISKRFYAEKKEQREKVYLEWLQKVTQTADIIKKIKRKPSTFN